MSDCGPDRERNRIVIACIVEVSTDTKSGLLCENECEGGGNA
jgi:hypothetical protein